MNSFYLILGSEAALSDRALTKLTAQLKDEKCEISTLFAADAIVGDIADALAPSLFSERLMEFLNSVLCLEVSPNTIPGMRAPAFPSPDRDRSPNRIAPNPLAQRDGCV